MITLQMLAKVNVKMRKLIESRLAFLEEKGRSGRRDWEWEIWPTMGEDWYEERSSPFQDNKTIKDETACLQCYMDKNIKEPRNEIKL